MKAVTLSDVASHAGVSPMTVSRVINGNGSVSPATRARVDQAISILKFRPNRLAQRLASKQELRIGLVYENPSQYYLNELLIGALHQTNLLGGSLALERVSLDEDGRVLLSSKGFQRDALIVPPPLSDDIDFRERLARLNIPIVYICGTRTNHAANEVYLDNYAAARRIVEFLISKGHPRIGCVKGPPNQSATVQRYCGYLDALSCAGVTPEATLVAEGDFTYSSGIEAGLKLLQQNPTLTSIFAANDDMAAGVLAAASQLGRKVPEDLSVVGFDDTAIASSIQPTLTTVRHPIAKSATQAVLMLERLTSDFSDAYENWKIGMDFELIERQSVQRNET